MRRMPSIDWLDERRECIVASPAGPGSRFEASGFVAEEMSPRYARHTKYRWRAAKFVLSFPSMTSTIGGLFELLIRPPDRSESEMAGLLGLDLAVVRARLVDLRKRGILAGPFGDGSNATWRSWFTTLAATIEASERSGLRVSRSVLLPRAWWDGMWANP